MIRKPALAILIILLVFSTAAPAAANTEAVFQALKGIHERYGGMDPGDPQAREVARQFFQLVQSEAGSGTSVINALKQLKSANQNRWGEVRRNENFLMAVVRATLEASIGETMRNRAGKLGSIAGYGFSGKWPIKPDVQLTFDGDFDVTLFATKVAESDPSSGVLAEVASMIRSSLGVEPEGLSIVFTGVGHEMKADVYVTTGAKRWAVNSSMTKLYLVRPNGTAVEITGRPEVLLLRMQLGLLQQWYPNFFENGRLKRGVTMEMIGRVLGADPRIEGTFKVYILKGQYTAGQAAAAAIDLACHVTETGEGTNPLERMTKVAKQVARSNQIVFDAISGDAESRAFFTPEEVRFATVCASLDRAKITAAEAEKALFDFQYTHPDLEVMTVEDYQRYQELIKAHESARNDLQVAELRISGTWGNEAEFTQRALALMRKQGQISHRKFVFDVIRLPAAERARAIAEYEADLKAVLEHYSKNPNVPPDNLEWAREGLRSVEQLRELGQRRPSQMEFLGQKFTKLMEFMNRPVATRQQVRGFLIETEMGKSIVEKVPEWVFAEGRPPAVTDIAFASPTKLVAEAVMEPVGTALNTTASTLMLIDLVWQIYDVYNGQQTFSQKMISIGTISAMILVPHLYLVPMVYHASLTGDPSKVSFVMACYMCPPLMIPMLVEGLGNRAISAGKRALFQGELEAMLQASAFNPEAGKEPKEWRANRDLIRYSWVSLSSDTDTYFREGDRSLAVYIRRLASDSREEIPLSAKNMTGTGALVLPGGVAKSFRAMIYDGDHKLFQENAALGQALQNLQKFNCDSLVPFMETAPSYCRYAWADKKMGIRMDLVNNSLAEGEEARLKAEGKSGEVIANVVKALLAERAKLQDQVVGLLAESIITSFEDEMRARKLVEFGFLDENMKELEQVGEALGIKEPLLEAVNTDLGKVQGIIASMMAKKTTDFSVETRREMAKVIDGWLKPYRSIVQTQLFLGALAQGAGVPKSDQDRILKGIPPLQVDRAKDVEASQETQKVLSGVGKDAQVILDKLKGDLKGEDPRDKENLAALNQYTFTARVLETSVNLPWSMNHAWFLGPGDDETPTAFADRMRGEMDRSLKMKFKSFFGKPPEFPEVLDRYRLLARGYAEKCREIQEMYRMQGELFVVAPASAPMEQEVQLTASLRPKDSAAAALIGDARIEWLVGKDVVSSGPEWKFTPVKDGMMDFTVNAVKDFKGKNIVIATKACKLKITGPWKPAVTISGDREGVTGKAIVLEAQVKADEEMKKHISLEWVLEGEKDPIGSSERLSYTPGEGKTYTFRVNVLVTSGGKPFVAATATHPVSVTKKDEGTAGGTATTGGTIKLTAPKTAHSTELVSVTAQLPPDLAGKARSYRFDGSDFYDITTSPATKGQFPLNYSGPQKIEISAYDGPIVEKYQGKWKENSGNKIGVGFATVEVTNLKFDLTTPSNYEGGVSYSSWGNEATIGFRRKPESKTRPEGGKDVTSATCSGAINLEVSGGNTPADCKISDQAKGDYGKDAVVRAIQIGDFKGEIIETPVRSRYRGHYEYVDLSFPEASVSGGGSVCLGKIRIKIGYSGGAGGTRLGEYPRFWYDDMPWVMGKSRQIQSELKGILASIKLIPDGKHRTEPYKEKPIPSVKLVASRKDKLVKGDVVDVEAVVENADPSDAPLTFTWTGDHAGKGAKVQFLASKPGRQGLAVAVKGAQYDIGTAYIEFDVANIIVKIERTPADTKPVPVGVKTGFRATLSADGKPASGNYIYRWQPHPEVAFDKLDSKAPDAAATFNKPGRTKVWVQVLETREGRQATVAESEHLEIEVIKPTLELSFDPKEPWVGQEVKAKLAVKPEVREIDFRWMPVPGNAKQSLQSQDGKEITFYLKDDKPAEIKVLARVPGSGEDLGEGKNAIKAKKYAVSVSGPKAYGPKPRVWKEGVGLVDVESAIAVDQIVEFAADTQPAPLTGPVKYQWSVTGGSCTVSNPTSREARATASAAGSCELSVVIRDKNDNQLGDGKGSFNATVTRETIASGQKKAKDSADSKTRAQDAKGKARKGDYDGAIKDAEDAARLDPTNKEASATADKLRKEKETIQQQIGKTKKLMDENKFYDAQRELIVASNLNSYYQPVQQANQELGTRWNKYNAEVRDKVYEVRSASERKEFGRALEIAATWRAATKLDPYAESALKQQEDWARQWKAQKDKQIGVLKAAGEKVKNYDYAGALKQYDEGFANGQNIYNGSEPEYKEAVELRGQAFTKNKRLGELTPHIRDAAENKDSYYGQKHVLDGALKAAVEAIALQPTNEQLKKWREQIVARAEKTKADNDRTAAGRKYLDTARSEENTYLSQVSYVQSQSGQWGENVEVDMQSHIQKAIDNYRESLKYIPDAAVEKKIKELEATLEGRKKYLENYRLSVTLKNEADALYRQATQDPDIQSASPKYDEAAEKYRKSLSLYRPFNAENVEKTIYVLEYYKHERWVKKYWADGQALEKESKIVEAIAIYDKAIASFHPTVPQNDRMYIVVHQQDLKNRVTGAKNWRADGEAKQKAGKIPEAIASYRQSLKLLPDAALEAHVRMLEGKQAEAGDKKASADKLWQEGTALFNQGRPSDALTKFKESLGYWSDATRTKYVADMEARRVKAVALRDEGSKLQGQNRIPEAIAKYKESLNYWPDQGLSGHIATLEGKVKQDADAAARKAKAKQLRDEGYALQQKNQLQAAVGKYKESLAVWPDKQLEDYIRQLEAKIAAVPPVVTPTTPAPPVTTPSTTSYDGTYSGTVSGASIGTVQFTVSGTSVTGTVSGKYGQDAYRATLSGTLNRSTGEISTKLAGDVTGTPFQGGLKGRIQGNSASGDWHARNQYGNPTGSWQASRGGSRKTEPTAAETAAATAAINIVGRWKTETIEGGKVDAVSYTVFNRDGSYTMDVSGEELAGVAVCTIRGIYTLSGQTLTLRPSGSQCKFSDGTTRSEPVDKYDTISGRVSGNDRSFTYLPGGNVSVRYTRQ